MGWRIFQGFIVVCVAFALTAVAAAAGERLLSANRILVDVRTFALGLVSLFVLLVAIGIWIVIRRAGRRDGRAFEVLPPK
jgi:hypothetical protein